ncbi:hypothetical protein L3Y34_005260 [Caenorhabditis briggsae]|uniref:Uncharacterized protein n=2 Tax=Caenorhabditis briggsae TaxID=6238 RepID=A0AAE9AE94_CAEBR|nr:hypothetical protein L3Y34_005260 [Caenorhabditis briggsae]
MAPRTKKKYASEFKELHGFYRIETARSKGNKTEEVKNSMMMFSQDKYYSLNYFIVPPSFKSSEELRYFVVDVVDIKDYMSWVHSPNEIAVRCTLNLDLFCRRHPCKKFYIRNLSRFIEDHLFFADEVFDLIPNIIEQQGIKFDRDEYDKCRSKYASTNLSVFVMDMRKVDIILSIFKVNREKVTIIDDFPSLKTRKLAFTSGTVEPVYSIAPCGQKVIDPLFACLFMFQKLVCGISWEHERCEDDADCMAVYKVLLVEALKLYAKTDKVNFPTLSSVVNKIQVIKDHACKKPHKAYPKPDHNFAQNKHTAMIPFSKYQEICAAFQLPVFRSFLWEQDEKKDELPVWVTRVLLTAGWVFECDFPEYIKNHVMSRLASVQPERGVSGPLYAFADKISNPVKNGNPRFYDQPAEPESNALSKQKKRNEMLQKKKEEKKKSKGAGPPDTNKRTPRTPAEQLVLEMRYQEHMEKTMAMEVEDTYYGMESLRTISLDKIQKERFQPPIIKFPFPHDAAEFNCAKPRAKSSLPLDKYGTPLGLNHLSQEEADRLLYTPIGQLDMNELYKGRGNDPSDAESENLEDDPEYKKLIVNAPGSSESVPKKHKPERVELEDPEPENQTPEREIFDKEIEWINMDSSTADALIWTELDKNDPSEMTLEDLKAVMTDRERTRTEAQTPPPKASQADASTQIDPTIIWCRKCLKTSDRCTAAQNDLKTTQNQLKNYEKKALRTDEVEKKLKEMNGKLEEKEKDLEQKAKDMKKLEKTQNQTNKSKEKEIENLKKSLESKINEIREVKSSLDVAKQNFVKIKDSEAEEKRKNTELRCQIHRLNDELQNKRLVTEAPQPDDLLNQISRLRVEMDRLEMEKDIVSHKDNEKQEALNELKELKRASDEIHERTRQQFLDETTKNRQLESLIETLRKEMESLTKRESFDKEKRELETKLESANTLLASKNTQHAMELRLLEKQLQTGKQELAEKEVQYLRLMSHNSSMEASLNMCKQTMERQSDQITEFMQEKSQVVSLQEKIRRLEYENHQQKLQIQRNQYGSSVELQQKIRNLEFENQQQMSTIRTLSQLVTQNSGGSQMFSNNNPAEASTTSSSTSYPSTTAFGIRTTPPTDPFISIRKCFICHDPIKTTHQVISCKNCAIPSHSLCGQRLAMDNDPCWSCGKKFDQLE